MAFGEDAEDRLARRDQGVDLRRPLPGVRRRDDMILALGRSNKEIAAALRVSDETVKTHVSSVLAKLGVADRTQAALYAVRNSPA